MSIFTTNANESPIHVTSWNKIGDVWPFFRPNWRSLEDICIKFNAESVYGFVPTGWTHQSRRIDFSVLTKDQKFEIHLVPYSEHSSFNELQQYVRFFRVDGVIILFVIAYIED